jgi:hypothetical protein
MVYLRIMLEPHLYRIWKRQSLFCVCNSATVTCPLAIFMSRVSRIPRQKIRLSPSALDNQRVVRIPYGPHIPVPGWSDGSEP